MPSSKQLLDRPARTGWQPTIAGPTPLIDADPDLADRLAPQDRRDASRALRVSVLGLRRGAAALPGSVVEDGGWLMVLDGFLLRSIDLGPVSAAEVLGPGDVIESADRGLLEVPADARVASSDAQLVSELPRWPAIASAISERLAARARRLSFMLALSHLKRTEDRVLATFWYLGGEWGRVAPDGLVVPLKLTHEQLARVVVARRPSVTTGLGVLQSRGLIARRPDRLYVVTGRPPSWLGPLVPGFGESVRAKAA